MALLEKMPECGGSTLTSGGSFAFAGTAQQRSLGIDDSPERLVEDLLRISGGRADPALVKLYAGLQLDTHAWLEAQGVVFHKVSLSSNTSVPRTHPTLPGQVMDAMHARVLDCPAVTWFQETAAERLDPGSGRAWMVKARARGASRVLCAPAVVLASGGFARNPAMVARYAPSLARARAWGGAGNTGDGIVMAMAHGAALADMEYVAGTFGVALAHYPDLESRPGDEVLLRMAMYRGAIAVNLGAERFADESLSYKILGTRCLEQPGGVAFQVFDQPIMDQSARAPNLNDFEDAFARGVIHRAATLADLARAVGLSPERLAATVGRYNAAVTRGHDPDFGRATLGGGYGTPVRIDTPPYYILPCCTALLATYCGLRVDTDMRVLRGDGSPVPGLYAAGETVGGFHGAGYMSGSALGKAAIFGRVAGTGAARDA